jgi:integrase
MAKMARTTWLLSRNGRYYLQCRVPSDLIGVVGKKLIKKSLHTSDRTEALERLAPEAAEVSELFAAARRKLKTEVERLIPDLTDSEAKRLAYLWFRRTERDSVEDAFREPDFNLAALEDARFLLGELLSGDDEVLVAQLVQQAADAVLIEAGFPSKPEPPDPRTIQPVIKRRIPDVDNDSVAYKELCRRIHRGMVENVRRNLQRYKGQPTATIDPAFAPEVVEKAATGPLLSKILELWLAERQPPAQTERDWRLVVRRFTELHGDLSVDTISKAHVREFKDALLQIPKVLPRRIQKLSVPKILAATKGMNQPRLSAGAVTKQLKALQSLLSWSVANGYLEHNVAMGITVAQAKEVADKRIAFDADDLQKIFAEIGQFRVRNPSGFWLPLLAAYTGARAGELIQLGANDICHRDGIDFISINAENGKSLKTKSSIREVPIHPELVKCGFLEYVAARRAAGDDRLFLELKRETSDRITEKFSKAFLRYRRSIGITDPRKVFHSFRHSFKEACRAASIGEEIHDSLTGHSNGSVGRGYGGVPLTTKAEAISKITYNVELGHLHAK